MPIYVYECATCNDVFEVEQRITEDALENCKCGSEGSLKRLIQPVGIAFKGTGFYVNDSAKPSIKPSDCTGEPSSCACSTSQD